MSPYPGIEPSGALPPHAIGESLQPAATLLDIREEHLDARAHPVLMAVLVLLARLAAGSREQRVPHVRKDRT